MEITKEAIRLYWITAAIFSIAIFGMFFNFQAVSLNGGRMPVFSESTWETYTHFTFKDFKEVEVPYLTDIFGTGDMKWSIGDVFLLSSMIGLILIHAIVVYSSFKLRREK